MLELLGPYSTQTFLLIIIIMGAILLFILKSTRVLYQDIEVLSDVTRSLMRTGQVAPRIRFGNQRMEMLWRKLLAFYAGVSRMSKIKGDAESVISSAIDLMDVSSNSKQVLQVLADVILRSSSPESKFVAIAEYHPQKKTWLVSSSSGISRERLEAPITIALEGLPLENGRQAIYANRHNGSQFDFSGFGVGLSLFVPIVQEKVLLGMVWIGFGQQVSVLEERRRESLELIIQHAVVSYLAAQKSEQKNNNALDQKDRILALSHDLKAPGVRALYALRELKASVANKDNNAHYLVNEIEYALEEQLGYIGELFNFDALDYRDNFDSKSYEIELASTIKNRVDSFRIVARSVNLEIKLGDLHRARVKIPKEVFNRIIDNLISNAIKYTHLGYIQISTIPIGNRIEIKVEDTGRGVQKELVPFLFSAKMRDQVRLDNSGQGFGLSVVRKLLEDWGGGVKYIERPSGGAVFTVNLPVVAFLDSSNRRDLATNSVLLVDDDLIVRSVHAKWIKGITGKLSLASSFSEALEIIQIEKPALVIADVNIPGESFFDFLHRLDSEISLIILTAQSRDSIHPGIEGLLKHVEICEKPVERGELIEVVSKIMLTIGRMNGLDEAA